MDQLTAMRVFVAIATNHSFKIAAEHLDMTPSVVSKHLAALENHLGTLLIERTTRSLKLTEVGLDYLERCNQILGEIVEAETMISSSSSQVRGLLRVSSAAGFAHRHIAPHIPKFRRRHRQLTLDLISSDRPFDKNSDIDVSIEIAEPNNATGVENRILAPNSRKLVASPTYLEKFSTPTEPADLARHQLITHSFGNSANEWHFHNPDGSKYTFRANGQMRFDNGDTIMRAALNDGGLAMLPSYIVSSRLQTGSLVSVMDDLIEEDVPIIAVYKANSYRRPKIEAFLDYLVEEFGEQPYWEKDTATTPAAQRASL